MKKKRWHAVIIIVLVPISILLLLINRNMIKLPFENIAIIDYAFNINDDRELVGISHNVFVAKVTRKIGFYNTEIGPVTRFEVQPFYNIKGDLTSAIIVQQEGGYKNGILNKIHEGEIILSNGEREMFLEPGTTYLLSTTSIPDENLYHMISHHNARKIISQDSTLSVEELKTLAQRDERVKQLEEAYKNEILNETDVENNYTRNTHKELHESIEK